MPRDELRGYHRALHHTIIVQKVPDIPGLEVPVLYLTEPGGEAPRPLRSLTDYFVANSARSLTWMLTAARGLGALFDYVRQRGPHFRARAAEGGTVGVHRLLLGEFTNHLLRGTVPGGAPDGREDPTGLYWRDASPDTVASRLRGIEGYVRWLDRGGYGDRIALTQRDSPMVPETGGDIVRFLYVARIRKSVDLLAHLKTAGRRFRTTPRGIIGPDTRSYDVPDHVQFPRRYLLPLLTEGFVTGSRGSRGGTTEDMAAKLVAILCAFGGLRRCEPLHLWVQDVQTVDGEPVVFLHHPVRAKVTHPEHGEMTRAEYLRTHCAMEPRNWTGGKLHAGWKGLKVDRDWSANVYWLPFDGVRELFRETFERYLFEVRPRLMAERRRRGLPDHPFLLVCSGAANRGDDTTSVGAPYTAVAFRRAWIRAIGRLRKRYGDDALVVRKAYGTTPHGLRHSYGGLLAELGLDAKTIQECMHHISPFSQLTYTRPPNAQVNRTLNAARERVRTGAPDGDTAFAGMADALLKLREDALGAFPWRTVA